jgi:Major Facilitator Superfamily
MSRTARSSINSYDNDVTENATSGWQPLRTEPPLPKRERRQLISAFTRLARTHTASAAGDAAVAIALAGSLFFDIGPGEARSKIALYLVFTMAPFAVVAPLMGPLLDRLQGGRRWMVTVGAFLRALLCASMIRHLQSNWLFPQAFLVLVLSKTYAISKSALVPRVVRGDDELVEANAKLGLLSGIGGLAVAIPALGLRAIFHTGKPVLALASMMFLLAAVYGLKLPREAVAEHRIEPEEKAMLRSIGIALAASAMAVVRATVGFLSFHMAFWLREKGTPVWWFGVVVAASSIGAFAGNALAPKLRERLQEETMLAGCLGGIALLGLLVALDGSKAGAAVLSAAVGVAASVGRLAFDAIVQQDAPEANRGRAFARFETRFQVAWVAAAFVPVVIHLPARVGLLCVGLLAVAGLVSFLLGTRMARERGQQRVGLLARSRQEISKRRAQELGRSAKPKRLRKATTDRPPSSRASR